MTDLEVVVLFLFIVFCLVVVAASMTESQTTNDQSVTRIQQTGESARKKIDQASEEYLEQI